MIKPNDFCFNIQYDDEIGYYVVFARHESKHEITYDRELIRIVPAGLYPASEAENIFKFDLDPQNVRDTLKRRGFKEDLDLI